MEFQQPKKLSDNRSESAFQVGSAELSDNCLNDSLRVNSTELLIITNTSRKEGLGVIYHEIILTIIYCKYHNYIFKYNPIKQIEHNYTNDTQFINKIENLMNIKATFPCLNGEENIQCDYQTVLGFTETRMNELFQKGYFNYVKDIFWSNKNNPFSKKDNSYMNSDSSILNIAVHIRRPNPHDSRVVGSDTPDDFYINIMNKIKDNYSEQKDKKQYNFYIYSQGDTNNFEIYKSLASRDISVILKINYDIVSTFTEMVAADVLVTSRSCFSYTVALLSKGDIYYQNFWYPPMDHWKIFYN